MLRVTVIGNLGQDPVMRYLPSGTPVTNYSVASNRQWTDADGEKQEEVVWLRISVFGKRAENDNQYLAKGRQVYVEGRLRVDPQTGGPRIWTGRDGEPRASFEVTASYVKYLGSRNGSTTASVTDDVPPESEDELQIPF